MSDPRVIAPAKPATDLGERVASSGAATNGTLWFALFAPPAAWTADELVSISVHYDYCAALTGHTFVPFKGTTAVLIVVGLVMLAVSISAGLLGWRAHSALNRGRADAERSDTGRGDTDQDRRRFMAHAALILSALFSYGIILRWITVFFITPSHCGS